METGNPFELVCTTKRITCVGRFEYRPHPPQTTPPCRGQAYSPTKLSPWGAATGSKQQAPYEYRCAPLSGKAAPLRVARGPGRPGVVREAGGIRRGRAWGREGPRRAYFAFSAESQLPELTAAKNISHFPLTLNCCFRRSLPPSVVCCLPSH